MFVLQIQEHGYSELQLGFEKLAAEFQDWRHQFELLEPESTLVIERRFEQEGPGWLELTAAYAKAKDQKYPGKTILRRTDALYLSFESGNADNVMKITPLGAEFGSQNDYGGYQPDSRLIVDINNQDEERFLTLVLADKTERIRELGFDVN